MYGKRNYAAAAMRKFLEYAPGNRDFVHLKLSCLGISRPSHVFEMTFHIKVQQKQQSSSSRYKNHHTAQRIQQQRSVKTPIFFN